MFKAVKGLLGWRVIRDDSEIEEISQYLVSLHTRGLSDQTIRSYAFDLADLHNWIYEEKKIRLSDFDKYKLHEYIRYQKRKGLKPRTINRRLVTAGCFYRFHFNCDLPSGTKYTIEKPYYKGQANPWAMGIHRRRKVISKHIRVKVAKKVIKPLTVEEVLEFFKSIRRYRDLAIVKLMLRCGLRSLEVLLIKSTDVNVLDQEFIVRGKGDKERKLPLPPDVISTIQKYIYYERPKECKSPYLFVVLKGDKKGQPLSREGLRKIFRYRRKSSGITHANPHRFRHTFAVEMVRGKVSVESLRKLMGHSDIRQTMDYVDLDMSTITQEFEAANERLKEIYEKRRP